jgi:hypothetical protein
MSEDHTILKQSVETFERLILIRSGKATQAASTIPGLLRLQFDDDQGKDIYEFQWISSVMYCDELLCTAKNFPYFSAAGGKHGLYECVGSSYLDRIRKDKFSSGQTFASHRHFVFWDANFNWNITSESVSKSSEP